MHRANPVCESCHKFMDPMGLALDNFDVAGQWRVKENGQPLDTRGELYDGTPISNPAELVDALLNRPIPLVRTFTLNLMAYAMGRRVEYTDQPALRAIVKEAEEDGYKMSSFIMAVISVFSSFSDFNYEAFASGHRNRLGYDEFVCGGVRSGPARSDTLYRRQPNIAVHCGFHGAS